MKMVKILKKNKNGDLELDQLGKLILGTILLIILIYIVGYLINGEFSNQGNNIKDTFTALR